MDYAAKQVSFTGDYARHDRFLSKSWKTIAFLNKILQEVEKIIYRNHSNMKIATANINQNDDRRLLFMILSFHVSRSCNTIAQQS